MMGRLEKWLLLLVGLTMACSEASSYSNRPGGGGTTVVGDSVTDVSGRDSATVATNVDTVPVVSTDPVLPGGDTTDPVDSGETGTAGGGVDSGTGTGSGTGGACVAMGFGAPTITVTLPGCVIVSKYPSYWVTNMMYLEISSGDGVPADFSWVNDCTSGSGVGTVTVAPSKVPVGAVSSDCDTRFDFSGTGTLVMNYAL